LEIVTKQITDIETSLGFVEDLTKLIGLIKLVKKVLDMVKTGLAD
jgi:hypothetical protein